MDFSKKQSAFKFRLPGVLSLLSASLLALISTSMSVAGGISGDFTPFENLYWSPEGQAPYSVSQGYKATTENEVQLFHVTSDALKGVLDIKAVVGANSELLGLKYITEKGEVLQFSIDQLSRGADLMKEDGMSVVKILGHQLSATSGGNLELIYLRDGLSGSYSKFNMNVVNAGRGWEMETLPSAGSRKFTKMFLKGNWFFGKVIGISEVSVN
ncbi:MAG: hypothetical protein ABIQ95_14830 [Bdellovibrionia bacterium]